MHFGITDRLLSSPFENGGSGLWLFSGKMESTVFCGWLCGNLKTGGFVCGNPPQLVWESLDTVKVSRQILL